MHRNREVIMKFIKIISFLTFILMSVIVGNLFASVTGTEPVLMVAGLLLIGALTAKQFPKNVLMLTWSDMSWADGSKNMGGLKTIAYFAPISSIDNFPELPANPSNEEEEVTLESVTGFTFLTSGLFYQFYSTQDTSEVVDEAQGEPDGMSFVHKGTIFHPGTKAEALAFAAKVNNTNMVFVLVEATGNMRVIGSKAFPAKCKASVASGKATADRKGVTIEIQSYGYTPAPLYTGPISLTPAV